MDQKGVNNLSLDEKPKNSGIIDSYQFLMERTGADDIYFSKERTEDEKKESLKKNPFIWHDKGMGMTATAIGICETRHQWSGEVINNNNEDRQKENNNELPDLELPDDENLKHDGKDALPSDKSNNKGSYPNIYIGPQGMVMKMTREMFPPETFPEGIDVVYDDDDSLMFKLPTNK